MKKVGIIALLIVVGIIAGIGLVMGALLEVAEAIIGIVVWSVIILAAYFFIKAKT